MNTTKRSFLTSLVSLVLCFTMLLGTTFAWFTDVVTSSGNVIQSGKLDAEMYWSDKYLTADANGWKQVKDNKPIFTYDKWEPGYTEIKYIKIANEGSLNLKWQLTIEAEGEVTNLSDVIDVYYVNPVTAKLESLDGLQSEGKLTDVLANKTAEAGSLTSGTSTVLAIAFHMDELAGNDYQGKKLCEDGFSVKLLATQATGENDSFDDQYDAEAQWPNDTVIGNTASAPADNVNGFLGADVSMTSADGKISANVPAGTKLGAGTNNLTLNVANMDKSKANITLDENEASLSIDVHILGVDKDNDVVMEIAVKELLPVGLNMGNYRFYHVENGNTVEMTLLADGATPVHNNYEYDPATGDVVLYLKSFSEVALVANNENAWKGEFDYDWYNTSDTYFEIANADQLAAFGAIVGGMKKVTGRENNKYTYSEEVIQDSFSGKTVKLIADINLGDKESENNPDIIFYPIGYWNNEGTYERLPVGERVNAVSSGFYTFEGTFDGNGNTIANFYQNTWEMKGDHNWYDTVKEQYYRDGMGLFGRVYKGTVKNLTVRNFKSDGEIATTGAIAAYADGATFENIAIFDCNPRVYNIGNGGIVGCVGWYAKEANLKTTFKNITVDNSNKISALWGSYDVACGGIVGQYYPTSGQTSAGTLKNAGIHFDNCHVSAQMDVYNDVCGNYQYYAYRYAGMLIGSIRENTTNEDGKTIPDMTGISASGCTVNYGDWNDYYYCEFEKNGHPSYSGPDDYKFSRVDKSEIIFDENGNAIGCTHSHSDVEDNRAIFLPFYQLFTGYGWGVSSVGLKEYSGIVTDLGITEGDNQASVEKFEKAENAPTIYKAGQTISIGELFSIVDELKVPIISSAVNVTVSPATSEDKVSAIFNQNTDDWTKSTITFANDCDGSAKIVITDYFYCTATVIYLDEFEATPKFTAKTVGIQNAYTQITLGDIFSVNSNVTLGDITVIVTDPQGNEITITSTSSNWASETIDLTKSGTWTVAIEDADKYCAVTEGTFTVKNANKFINKFDKNFLYRVGNANEFDIGYIFGEDNTNYPLNLSNVNVRIENVEGNATGTFTSNTTWANGKLKFTGTGVVKVTISADGANAVELHLEVIEATNITSAVGTTTGGNFVLLCDINTTTYVNYWNCTLYGNGFTYSLKGAPTSYNSKHGHGILITKNATLDNLVIVGDVYNSYAAFSSQDDYNAAIDVAADTIIQNCYISGCAAPVRARSNVTIKDTTLYGGAIANMVIMSGTSTLENVITANYSDGRALVGLGVVVHSDATEGTKLVLKGTFTQHNFMSESNAPTDSYAKNIHSAMFKDNCKQYHFGTSPNRYVNTGIISMTSTFTTDDIIDNANTGYVASDVTLSGYDGFVYTQPNTSGSINNEYDKENDSHYSKVQGAVPPSYFFDYTNKNYVAKADGSNDYCYEENGKVNISMDDGDTFNWDTSILLIGKGITIYTVSMNGIDYTGKSIAFKTSGDYIVTYTYTDDINYTLDENGNVTLYSVTYTKTVNITVSVIKDTTKHAEFTMGSSNTATEKITVDNATYISATSVTVDGTKWGSMNVNGTTIIFPIIEATIVQTKASSMISTNAEVQAHFYVFDGVITITDYENAGTGNKVIFNSDTKDLPTGLNVVKGKYGAITTDWYKNSDSNLTSISLAAFRYAASTDGTLGTYQNKLCYSSPSGLSTKNRGEYYTIAQYSYTDNAGSVYYYYVGYHMQNSKNVAPDYSSGCFAEGSLVTLADGTQKPIEEITFEDQLLAWDFNTGKYAVTVPSLIDRYELSEQNVINLQFADGTVVRVVIDHGFFDVEANKFVFINEENVASYVGHTFVKASENGTYENVELVGYEITVENIAYYSIQTAVYNNCIVEGVFTLCAPPEMIKYSDWFNYFEIGEGMKYDEEKMQADIEQYGLYTYEDFAEYVTYEQFMAFNGPYLKVLVGRGVVTYEQIIELISIYVNSEN